MRDKRGIVVLRRFLVLILGMLVGAGWLWHFATNRLQPAKELHDKTCTVTVISAGYGTDTEYGTAFEGELEISDRTYRAYIYLNEKRTIAPGDSVTGGFRFRFTAIGEDATYHRGKGIFLLAYQSGEIIYADGDSRELSYFPVVLRQKLLDQLDILFPEDTVGIARGLLLGDSSKIDYETDTALQLSGIRHVIAVSGLHVSILFLLIYVLMGKRTDFTALIGLPVLFLFSAVAGETPSITRACIMQIWMILALKLRRDYDAPTALAVAVLVILGGNPMAATSVSFQLSAGSVAGILLFSGRVQAWLMDKKRLGRWKRKTLISKLSRWAAASISVSLGASVTTAPLTAYYFGTVSVISVLTNLLTLWVITFIFYGILLACALGVFSVSAGAVVANVVSWLIRYVTAVAKGLSRLPVAAVYTVSSYAVAWLVFCYVAFAIFCLSRKKAPMLLAFYVTVSLCIALGLSWTEPLLHTFRATAVDVGQGQCILLQSRGNTYMVDCGGSDPETAADTAAEVLLSQGIARLDGLILTHYDADHAAGVQYLLQRIEVDAVYLPDVPDESGTRETVASSAEPGAVFWVSKDQQLSENGIVLSMFVAENGTSDNESSLCVLFQAGDYDILITGDRSISGERELLLTAALPELDVLVAGHHGSKHSTGALLLEATKPKYVLISVGQDNRYGHPNAEVLGRLEQYGCKVFRTDLHGTIMIER